MSVVGRASGNHPLYVNRGLRPEIDDRATTPEVFGPLNERFRFTIDVAASKANAKCPRYYTAEDDGLTQDWSGERVWCNPPYSKIAPWVAKAWREWDRQRGPELIVMLIPANRTEQGWWQEHVERYRDRPSMSLRVEFLPGRIRFLKPGQENIAPGERPPFGCCLLTWSRP